jgi:hypothetical protein
MIGKGKKIILQNKSSRGGLVSLGFVLSVGVFLTFAGLLPEVGKCQDAVDFVDAKHHRSIDSS